MAHKSSNTRNSGHLVKKTRTRVGLWGRLVYAAIAVIVVTAGGFAWHHHTKANEQTATYKLTLDTPTPARYMDTNPIIMTVGPNRVAMPEINPDRDMAAPTPLRIYYSFESGNYAPAMRMDLDAANLANAIKMTPAIRGKWTMPNPNMLMFTPDGNWPADTKFRIKISPRLINSDVHVNSRKVTFVTPRVAGTVDSFDVYPTGRGTVTGVGVVSFNYPVSGISNATTVKLNGNRIHSDVRMDTNNRTAIITTQPIPVRDIEQSLSLGISGATPTRISANTTIAAADNFFKITDITTAAVDDESGTPRQLVIITTSAAVRADTDWQKFIDVYLLPRQRDTDERSSHRWATDEITPDVLKKSKKLSITPTNLISPNGTYQYAFSYDVSDANTRYIYVTVREGIMSDIGFATGATVDKTMTVPYPQRSVKIAGDGALLSLNGDQKIGIVARGGVNAAYINVSKIKDTEINHLISQTYNIFTPLNFKSWSFGVDDMAVVFKKRIPFSNTSPTRVNYASVDLGEYLNKTPGDKTGIFVIQSGTTQSAADYNDRRLILMTNMGIIRKINSNGSSAVFVSLLDSGGPAGGIDVSVLGRNGNTVWTGVTNERGRVDIPVLKWNEYRGAREPIAIVARNGSDVCFVPYDAGGEQMVEYSKFDTGGVYATPNGALNAYVFSDRGIYRPGHELIIGAIVQSESAKSTAGIPVRVMIDDARGRSILDKKISLGTDGMFDVRYRLGADAPLGEYTVTLYSINSRHNTNDDVIGRTTFRVAEFTPDTMKINTKINNASDVGWISPSDMTANVTLNNLFGTPAQNRRITARATLSPSQFRFDQFPGYAFTPNIIGNSGLAANSGVVPRPITMELADVRTNDNGDAVIKIDFDRSIPSGTYVLNLNVRGFDGDGGRNVEMTTTARVSDATHLVGWRADGNLDYINRGTTRSVHIVSVDTSGTAAPTDDWRMRVIARENLTSLIKDASGYYKYQSTIRDRVIRTTPLTIPKDGQSVTLDTTVPGTYTIQIIDKNDRVWASIPYFVAGTKNITMTRDSAAELTIKLNRSEYAPGDNVAVSITAPYAGTGLITIERDRVYAYKWFNTTDTTSVQYIRIPDDFDGSGYINVSFVRDINSRDIFTSPYTYAVTPFTARDPSRKINITISAPKKIETKKLNIEYNVSQSSRLMIFAVDRGILQVGRYTLPRPLAHFYQKYALGVQTYQILSLILPEYRILNQFAKTGGGDYDGGANGTAPQTNPFGRRVAEPVAFYSGIINAHANKPGHVTFDIPEYFNGQLDIYAVAASSHAVGSASTNTTVQSPVMVTPSMPLFAAPGDTFTAGAIITNTTDDAHLSVDVTASKNIQITTNTTHQMDIPNGSEKLLPIGIRASDVGPSEIQFVAKTDAATPYTANATATMTVRPISTFESVIRTGVITQDRTTVRRFNVDMYPDNRTRQIYISRGNAVWMRPLMQYLDQYDFDCSEQLASRALGYVLMPNNKILGTTYDTAAKRVNNAITKLRGRQNPNGSFALWPADDSGDHTPGVTAYVTEFLMDARDGGFTVSPEMISRAVDYMRDVAGMPVTDQTDLSTQAWLIYLITRAGYVTTNYISAFEEYANKNAPNWPQTISGPYIAAAYKILKQSDRADQILGQYRAHTGAPEYRSMFNNTVANDAIAAYITRTYFGMENDQLIQAIRTYINRGNYTSYTSAMAIRGLAGKPNSDPLPEFTVTADKTTIPGSVSESMWTADIADNIDTLTINCPTCDTSPMTYTIIMAGYPRHVRPTEQGIEITRHYYDASGHRITSAKLGQDVTVKITARAIGDADNIPNVAIVDMLPGAFNVMPETLAGNMTHGEVREDRVLIFANITRMGQEFTYTATAGIVGDFAVPPISAASMYNPGIRAITNSSRIIVTDDTGR